VFVAESFGTRHLGALTGLITMVVWSKIKTVGKARGYPIPA
jgi:hypothetical protein